MLPKLAAQVPAGPVSAPFSSRGVDTREEAQRWADGREHGLQE